MTSTIEVVPIFFVAQRSHINRYFITFAHKNDSGSFDNILTKAFLLYPLQEIRQIFQPQDRAVTKRLCLPTTTPARGASYGNAWGGLFSVVRAFGDASCKIN